MTKYKRGVVDKSLDGLSPSPAVAADPDTETVISKYYKNKRASYNNRYNIKSRGNTHRPITTANTGVSRSLDFTQRPTGVKVNSSLGSSRDFVKIKDIIQGSSKLSRSGRDKRKIHNVIHYCSGFEDGMKFQIEAMKS